MKPMQSIAALAFGSVLVGGCGSHAETKEPLGDEQLQPPVEPANMQPAERTGPPANAVQLKPPSSVLNPTERSKEPSEQPPPPT